MSSRLPSDPQGVLFDSGHVVAMPAMQSHALSSVIGASVLGEVSGHLSCRRHHGPCSGKLAALW